MAFRQSSIDQCGTIKLDFHELITEISKGKELTFSQKEERSELFLRNRTDIT